MDVNPGHFDRLITIERIVSRGNTFGAAGAETWQEVTRVWARARGFGSKERFQNESGIRAAVSGVFTVAYTDDILSTDRIIHEGRTWRIIGLSEIGYKELLEITAEVPDE